MTLCTVASHLSSMKVRMAIGTLFSHTIEYKFGVALPACRSLMHAAKREPGLGMVEIWKGADRPVARRSMTGCTYNAEGTVRAARCLPALLCAAGRGQAGRV